jgi:hypothetical protein
VPLEGAEMPRWWVSIAGTGVLAAALPLAGAAEPASAQTVVAYWKMDESAGATAMVDATGNGHNGVLHNVTTAVDGPSHLGTAYQFGGSTTKSYVEVASSPSLDPGTQPISITFWINTKHLPSSGDYDLVRKGVFPGQEYKIELEKTGKIACTFHGSHASNNATGGSNIANGTWHKVVCAENSSGITLTIDGTVVATTKVSLGSISSSIALEIGAHPTFDFYKGKLDDVSITIG